MILAPDLTKPYGTRTAIAAASLPCGPGRVSRSLGRRGAAKCTAMRILLGRERPAGGRIAVNRPC